MIETFDDLLVAMEFIENNAVLARAENDYFKAEIYLTGDGRWRVGIIRDAQLELKFD